MARDGKQDHVPREHRRALLDDLRRAGGLGNLGQPDHERATPLQAEHLAGRPGVRCLDCFRLHVRERLEQSPEMGAAARRGQPVLDAAAVGDETDLVAGSGRDLGERQRAGYGTIEHGLRARPGPR